MKHKGPDAWSQSEDDINGEMLHHCGIQSHTKTHVDKAAQKEKQRRGQARDKARQTRPGHRVQGKREPQQQTVLVKGARDLFPRVLAALRRRMP